MPENQEAAIDQLERYSKLGISIIEVQTPLTPAVWKELDRLGFEVYGNLGIQFPTTLTFTNPDSSLIRSIEARGSAYLSRPLVSAINLFEYGAIHRPSFQEVVQRIAEQLKSQRQINLYFTDRRFIEDDIQLSDFILWEIFITPDNLDTFSVPQSSDIGGYLFSPSEKLADYLTPFKNFLEQTSHASEKPIFIHQNWLDTILEKHSNFSEILRSVSSKAETVFPLPKESIPDSRAPVLPILLLLIVWGSVAWHFNSSPLYRKSLFRYFTAHKFFIDDIYQRHIRSSLPALLIILQNVLLLSVCIMITCLALLSPLGEEALLYHFPILSTFGNTLISVFIWAVLLTLLISFVSILWLYLAHKRIKSITQTATIYAWPQHINILLGTIVITLFAAGSGNTFIVIFTALAAIIFMLSFIFASLDTARYARSKIMHQVKTSGLYLILWGGLLGWILTNEQWIEIINLSLKLR